MAQHGRYFRPKDSSLAGSGYDSNLEKRLHESILSGAEHHPANVNYVWPHRYEPDFCIHAERPILIECKGYFQDRNDATKYLWVRKALPEGTELVFVFESPNKAIHFQPKRKDGTKMKHYEWAEKHGFRWFTEDSIQELFTEGTTDE